MRPRGKATNRSKPQKRLDKVRKLQRTLYCSRAKVLFCVRGVISPLLSNIFLNEIDRQWSGQQGEGITLRLIRYADDMVATLKVSDECSRKNVLGEPGKLHVRFDEGVLETHYLGLQGKWHANALLYEPSPFVQRVFFGGKV